MSLMLLLAALAADPAPAPAAPASAPAPAPAPAPVTVTEVTPGAAPTLASRLPASARRIRRDVAVLASDTFTGRGPTGAGEAPTLALLEARFKALGLAPAGDNGGYRHAVPLVRMTVLPGAGATIGGLPGGPLALVLPRDGVLTARDGGATGLVGAPIVFGGHGVVAPAKGHDPYAGVDLAGKVVLLLLNDPDFEAGADLGFGGRTLEVEGRAGSKIAALAGRGVAGVILLHEAAAASWPWSQMAQNAAVPRLVPPDPAPAGPRATLWVTTGVGERMLGAAGLSLAEAKARARAVGFRALPLGLTLAAAVTTRAERVVSHNVLARLPGTGGPGAGRLLYGAHWDANGQADADAAGDAIRNGAIDNATGTAELLEVARLMARDAGQGRRLAPDVLFAAWTAEEQGLLGADAWAAGQGAALGDIRAVINLDPHVALPLARNVELIGVGRNPPLEAALARAAAAHGVRVDPEPNPEAGWYFRSDHYPFARRGVPALAFRGGRDLVAGGIAAGAPIVADYNARHYHATSDAFDPRWRFHGPAQEASIAYTLGRQLAGQAR